MQVFDVSTKRSLSIRVFLFSRCRTPRPPWGSTHWWENSGKLRLKPVRRTKTRTRRARESLNCLRTRAGISWDCEFKASLEEDRSSLDHNTRRKWSEDKNCKQTGAFVTVWKWGTCELKVCRIRQQALKVRRNKPLTKQMGLWKSVLLMIAVILSAWASQAGWRSGLTQSQDCFARASQAVTHTGIKTSESTEALFTLIPSTVSSINILRRRFPVCFSEQSEAGVHVLLPPTFSAVLLRHALLEYYVSNVL